MDDSFFTSLAWPVVLLQLNQMQVLWCGVVELLRGPNVSSNSSGSWSTVGLVLPLVLEPTTIATSSATSHGTCNTTPEISTFKSGFKLLSCCCPEADVLHLAWGRRPASSRLQQLRAWCCIMLVAAEDCKPGVVLQQVHHGWFRYGVSEVESEYRTWWLVGIELLSIKRCCILQLPLRT